MPWEAFPVLPQAGSRQDSPWELWKAVPPWEMGHCGVRCGGCAGVKLWGHRLHDVKYGGKATCKTEGRQQNKPGK